MEKMITIPYKEYLELKECEKTLNDSSIEVYTMTYGFTRAKKATTSCHLIEAFEIDMNRLLEMQKRLLEENTNLKKEIKRVIPWYKKTNLV